MWTDSFGSNQQQQVPRSGGGPIPLEDEDDEDFGGPPPPPMATRPKFQVGEPRLGGSGCPAQSASVTTMHDEDSNTWSMTILFDDFSAATEGSHLRDRKACNLAIPVKVPNGFSTSVFKIDWRGNANIPHGGRGKMTAEYFWAGSQGPTTSKTINGPYNRNFLFTDDIETNSITQSPCGEDVILRSLFPYSPFATAEVVAAGVPRRSRSPNPLLIWTR